MTRSIPPDGGRRSFLFSGALAGAALAAPFEALAARSEAEPARAGSTRAPSLDYGPLFPAPDEDTGLPLLMLPAGFRYVSFGWTLDPLADGSLTPGAHDGMAAFPAGPGRVRLVRNHELGPEADAFGDAPAYDPEAGGGTTTVDFDTRLGRYLRSRASLSGTVRNCAGGPTPWGSWLTCEETLEGPAPNNDLTRPHGYVFEVDAETVGDPEPIRDMGRMAHEAVAVDPATGYVYETEDAGNTSGFYRFVPNEPGNLAAGGQLFMLALRGYFQADLTIGGHTHDPQRVRWVRIEEPDPADIVGNRPFVQGFNAGGARFARLEGCWYGGNQRVYIVSTSGGAAGQGQVWEYDPAGERLRLVFESPRADVLNAPDNICVSPRGGLVLCEDGSGTEYVHGLSTDGTVFRFAQNNVVLNGERNGIVGDFRGSEFAGATYSPDGRWLFFSVQSPGITFGVTGPWANGGL